MALTTFRYILPSLFHLLAQPAQRRRPSEGMPKSTEWKRSSPRRFVTQQFTFVLTFSESWPSLNDVLLPGVCCIVLSRFMGRAMEGHQALAPLPPSPRTVRLPGQPLACQDPQVVERVHFSLCNIFTVLMTSKKNLR